jgi:23S rRNA (adenine2503-C2)-methyltransferase
MNILDCTLPELQGRMAELGEPRFRADQVFQWLWQKRAQDFQDMSNVSKALRARLAEEFTLERPQIDTARVSSDGTVKLLLRLADGEMVETVLIPGKEKITQCLSSQVGCAMGCSFCATGTMGLTRNMRRGEIAGQILVARDYLAEEGREGDLSNLVFMGMGEPLMNLGELLPALSIIGHDLGLGFSSRRATVSTVGVPAGLTELGESDTCSLAVSLHAPTQALRAEIMPKAAKALPLDELMRMLDRYPLRNRQRITYEYLLLKDVNDTEEHAKELVKLLGQRKCKVNLIAYNPVPRLPYDAPDPDRVLAFEFYLRRRGLTALLRKSMGADIKAACGQLKAEVSG